MKTIAFIIPYFGNLPEMFPLWLTSCRYNSTRDFIVYTDNQSPTNIPNNVMQI